MLVFLCDDDFETILCGIYDAWSMGDHSQVRLEMRESCQRELFCSYRDVRREEEKAKKVIRSVKKTLSEEYFGRLYQIFLSCDEEKPDVMYRFLIKGFAYGKKAMDMLQDPDIARAFELTRFVGNESHFMKEFIRFEKMPNGIYLARIQPKNHVLPMIADHFSERLNPEHFLIYDETRDMAAVHPAGKPWFFMRLQRSEWDMVLTRMEGKEDHPSAMGEDYESLWRLFVDTIAVEGRINPNLQRQMMPYRYRGHMPEFVGRNEKSRLRMDFGKKG